MGWRYPRTDASTLRRFEWVPAGVFDHVVRTDLLGAATVARTALANFRAQGAGVLVLGGSLLSFVTAPYMGAYITSKWGLRGLARVRQQETRDAPGVHVCLIDPAGVDTPIYRLAANYDRLVGPLMRLGGLSRERVATHDGNVFAPRPALERERG